MAVVLALCERILDATVQHSKRIVVCREEVQKYSKHELAKFSMVVATQTAIKEISYGEIRAITDIENKTKKHTHTYTTKNPIAIRTRTMFLIRDPQRMEKEYPEFQDFGTQILTVKCASMHTHECLELCSSSTYFSVHKNTNRTTKFDMANITDEKDIFVRNKHNGMSFGSPCM